MPDQLHALEDARLEKARAALLRGEWESARAHFEARLTQGDDCPEAWEGLASACYWLQDTARMFEARKEAYRLYSVRRDPRSAARVAVGLGSDFLEFRGEPAVAAGWLGRAEQLLEGLPSSVEHAWLRSIEAHLTLSVKNDPEAARRAAVQARDIARELHEVDYEILARAVEGMAMVTAGEVSDGIRQLDAAAAAALGGEMADLNAISVTCCYVIQACERVRDFERASEWCRRFEEICARWHLGTFMTFCRIQHGTVLIWRGEWAEAEAELSAAQEDLERVRPSARAAILVRLGELRRRQGRWEEAAALLAESRAHRLAILWQGMLDLDRGDAVSAEDAALQALSRTSDHNIADRFAALELLVRARAARGATEAAAQHLPNLRALAESIGTESVRGGALSAAGVLARAREDAEDARRLLHDAADLFETGGSPYEAAEARLELARALLALGRGSVAEAQARAALESYERLGAAHGARRASALLSEIARPRSPERGAPPPEPLTRRQLEILRLVANGLSNRQIAARLSLSEFTVRRHLSNVYLRLGVSSRAAAVAHVLRLKLL